MIFELRALTDIWTGGADRSNDKLHLSGLKGSLRWWYEALVRDLGAKPCDPTDKGIIRCTLDPKKLDRSLPRKEQLKEIKGMMCPSCYFFGCTGWSGKVQLRVWTSQNDGQKHIVLDSLEVNDSFVLEFIPLKQIEQAEQDLVNALLKLIVDYGALGAKTVFKPSEIDFKNTKLHHRNFGIVAWANENARPRDEISVPDIRKYLGSFKAVKQCNEWPNLNKFWFVKGKHLTRTEHNEIVGRDSSGRYINLSGSNTEKNVFLGGFISRDKARFTDPMRKKYRDFNAASKKIFSFHGPAPIERCFGYVPQNDSVGDFVAEVIRKFPKKFSEADFQKGDAIISSL